MRKDKQNGDIEFAPVYFNSTTKRVIKFKYELDKSFQEVLYRICNWINKGSGWIIETVEAECANISVCSLLSRSSYNELSSELKYSMKVLININAFFGVILDT